jgi:hypothetical protein
MTLCKHIEEGGKVDQWFSTYMDAANCFSELFATCSIGKAIEGEPDEVSVQLLKTAKTHHEYVRNLILGNKEN